jgi:twitching motility protein PilT
MANKEIVAIFQKPPWAKPADVEGFLTTVGPYDHSDVLRVHDALLKLYGKTTQNSYRLACMAFIGLAQKQPSPELFAPFVKALKTPNALLVESLVHILPLVNSPKDHPLLLALLTDKDATIRQAARTLLERVANGTTVESLAQMCRQRGFTGRADLLPLARQFGGKGLPLIEAILASDDPDDVAASIATVGEMSLFEPDLTRAQGLIDPHLGSPDDAVAVRAISVFGRICDESTFYEKVIPHIYDPRPLRVRAVLQGLQRFPGKSAISTMEYKFTEGPNDIRIAVLHTLERMATDDVLPLLVNAIGHADLKVKGEAVRILRALTSEARIDVARALLWLLRSNDVNVRRMAAEVTSAIREGKEQLWPKLVRFLRDEDWWVRERVLDALVQLAGSSLTPHLVAMLDDPSAGARRVAVDGMALVGDPQALGALVRAASDDSDWWVREEAVRAIGRIKDARATPYILNFLENEPDLAVACIDTLTLLGGDSIDQVIPWLGVDDPEKRLAALRHLEVHGNLNHAVHVRALAFDHDLEVCQRARALLDTWAVKLFSDQTTDDDPTKVLDRLLEKLVAEDGDDLVLTAGRRVYMKNRGKMVPLTKVELSAEQTYVLLTPLLNTQRAATLGSLIDIDFSYYSTAAGCRFRINVFRAQFGLGAVFRRIKADVIPISALQLPAAITRLIHFKNGLVLVGGPPGAGKSTTLTALIDLINREQNRHVITIEDPVEAVHKSQSSLVNQREIGTDTHSFDHALRSMLRMDPDVILIGELRDYATIEFALRAAETGHLVFATVHTFSADATVERLVSAHPSERRDQARAMLAENLRAVLCQFLFQDAADPDGRVIATELMLNNEAIANVIRKNQSFQIPTIIQTSRDQGSVSMDASLRALYLSSRISKDDLYLRLRNKDAYEEITGDVPIHKQLSADGSMNGS